MYVSRKFINKIKTLWCISNDNTFFLLVDEVKKRMQSMRTAFSRLSKAGKSGSAAKNLTKKSAWMLEKLQFLLPFMKSRSSVSNLEVCKSKLIKN
jgi:hypothetical protein